MKNIIHIRKVGLFSILFSFSVIVFAGNEDRAGSAGASQLLINPWCRSSALGDANVANSSGLEATFTNIAGLAQTDKTQLKFNFTNWLGSAGIPFSSAGFAQRIGSSSVIAMSVQSMSFGNLMVTTTDNPEGGIGTFSPKMSVINLGYAKSFTTAISGGINIKVLSESISNVGATGIAIDAGIKYVTGPMDRMKMGITLKNVGSPMTMSGDGLGTQVTVIKTGNNITTEQRSQKYELPSMMSMGVSYDLVNDTNSNNKLTAAFAFTANSFSNDQYRLGVDYLFNTGRAAFNVRAGYVYEKNVLSTANRTNALTGLTAGMSVDVFSRRTTAEGVKKESAIGLEYAMRMSNPFGLIHSFGVTISLK
jgi:hypothetical protein